MALDIYEMSKEQVACMVNLADSSDAIMVVQQSKEGDKDEDLKLLDEMSKQMVDLFGLGLVEEITDQLKTIVETLKVKTGRDIKIYRASKIGAQMFSSVVPELHN